MARRQGRSQGPQDQDRAASPPPKRGGDVLGFAILAGVVAVLLISVELDEIMSLSDTIAVMYEGQFVAINPVDQVSAEQLGLLMTAG